MARMLAVFQHVIRWAFVYSTTAAAASQPLHMSACARKSNSSSAVAVQFGAQRSSALPPARVVLFFFIGRLIRVRGEAGTDQWRKRMALTVDSNALLEGDDELGEMIGQ